MGKSLCKSAIQAFCLLLFIILIVIIVAQYFIQVFALTPSESQQIRTIVKQELDRFDSNDGTPNTSAGELSDGTKDWVNSTTKQAEKKGLYSTDIVDVDYLNDGNYLNVTLWLYFPFREHPIQYQSVNYGILIDSDFNYYTGFEGIDYIYEIEWQNSTQSWVQKLFELSPTGDNKTLQFNKNFTGFFEGRNSYVKLSLDLNSIRHSENYKVVFYAEAKKNYNSSFLTDFTRWISFPPINVELSTLPHSLILRPGEVKTVAILVNSTKGYEPEVSLKVISEKGLYHFIYVPKLSSVNSSSYLDQTFWF